MAPAALKGICYRFRSSIKDGVLNHNVVVGRRQAERIARLEGVALMYGVGRAVNSKGQAVGPATVGLAGVRDRSYAFMLKPAELGTEAKLELGDVTLSARGIIRRRGRLLPVQRVEAWGREEYVSMSGAR